MNISENGVNFIKKWESFSPVAYKGPGEQYYTIGYGHYGPDVKPTDTITEPEASALLYSDLQYYVQQTIDIAVSKFPDMNQNQFDALVSYCYNRGPGASDGSNGLRQLIFNSNTLEEVSDNFTVYWGSNTAVQEGLLNRRRAERELFNGNFSSGGETAPPNPQPTPKSKKKKMNFLFIQKGTNRWKNKIF